ncbi:MAG TPA: hypothetical protein VGL98_13670 [Gammaproteobacteria bacterium]
MAAPRTGAATRIGGNDGVGPAAKDPWLGWAALVVPGFATALTWRFTNGLPYVNRVAIAVAVALVVYGVVHILIKGLPRR